MLLLGNFKTVQDIATMAMVDAAKTYHEVESPEELGAVNYEGDGESFQFNWTEHPVFIELRDKCRDDKEEHELHGEAQAFYLGVFWAEIKRLQDA